LVGTNLAGRGTAAPEIALKGEAEEERPRLSGRRRSERVRDGNAPLPAGGLRSAIGVARFEADRSISESKIGLGRRLAPCENEGISERFASLALLVMEILTRIFRGE
jgi:hypothetical protein